MSRFGAIALIAFVLCSGTTRYASAETINDHGLWAAALTQGKFTENPCDKLHGWKWWFDGHLRFFDDTDGFGLSIVRPGLGYTIAENTTLWAGYGWIHASPNTAPDFDESRFWQQLTWSKEFGCTKFGSRSRLEQRWVDTGDDTGWRFRQFFSLRRPVKNHPRLLWVAWDEAFFHLNDTDWGANSGFDQNRVFLGMGIKSRLHRNWRMEIGYLHVALNRTVGPDRSNHILAINLFRSP